MHTRRAWFTCSHLPLCTLQHTVLAATSGSDFEIDVEVDECQAMLRGTAQLRKGLCRQGIPCVDTHQRYFQMPAPSVRRT